MQMFSLPKAVFSFLMKVISCTFTAAPANMTKHTARTAIAAKAARNLLVVVFIAG